ncbi:alanine racemase C-terminal domain-containing protein, partial [Lentilactobacillus kisonensis]
CMDQFMVKLPEKFKYGTPVTIIGVSGNQTITVDDLAAYVGTINYEIICGLSDRLKRIYI